MREFTWYLLPRDGHKCQEILWSLAHCKWDTLTWPDSVTALVSRGWSQTLECSWVRLSRLSIDDDARTNSYSFVDGKSVQWAKEKSTKCAGSTESVLFPSGPYSSMFLAMENRNTSGKSCLFVHKFGFSPPRKVFTFWSSKLISCISSIVYE